MRKTSETPARGRRRIPPASRKRMGEAGARNLAAWKAAHGAPALKHGVYSWLGHGEVTPEIRQQLDEFESRLTLDLGGVDNLSAGQRALVRSARVSFGVVLLAQALLESSPSKGRNTRLASVLQTVISYQNSLRLTLKSLGLTPDSEVRRKPKTIAEAFGWKVAPGAEIEGQKGPISAGKLAEGPSSGGEA